MYSAEEGGEDEEGDGHDGAVPSGNGSGDAAASDTSASEPPPVHIHPFLLLDLLGMYVDFLRVYRMLL